MSLLHRALLSSAFQEMLKRFEPIVADTLETAVAVVAPAAAPLAKVVIDEAGSLLNQPSAPAGAITVDHVASVVAASRSAPSAANAPAPAAAPAASAPAAAAAPVVLSAGPSQAALAACDALALQLSNLATQLAAIRANVSGSSGA